MEYANHLSEYAPAPSEAQVAEEVARIRAAAKGYETDGVYRLCYSAIDLTTLSCSDSGGVGDPAFARAGRGVLHGLPRDPQRRLHLHLPARSSRRSALAVDGYPDAHHERAAGGFPASQTFLEVKMLGAC